MGGGGGAEGRAVWRKKTMVNIHLLLDDLARHSYARNGDGRIIASLLLPLAVGRYCSFT